VSDARELESAGRDVIDAVPQISLDYLAVVNPDTMDTGDSCWRGSAAIIAARVGSTRLIDNLILGDDDQD
jgi:pantoate--beta-alanine ligase